MIRQRGQHRPRRRAAIGVLAAVAVASLGVPGTARASVPKPLAMVAEGSIGGLTDSVMSVLGEGSTGGTFVIDRYGQVAAIHGSHGLSLQRSMARPGEVASDGRLWGAYANELVAVADTIEGGQHIVAVPKPDGGVEPAPTQLTAGPDGRMWFLDPPNHRVGSIDLDGTGLTTWTSGGTAEPVDLAAGPDGRMWFTRTDRTVAAVATATGAVTEVTTTYARYEAPLASFDGVLWSVSNHRLVQLAADGTETATTILADNFQDLQVADGRLWAISYQSSSPGPLLYGVARSGSPAQTDSDLIVVPVPVTAQRCLALASSDVGPGVRCLGRTVSLAPTRDGTGLLGTETAHVWRFDHPSTAPRRDVSVVGSLVNHSGYQGVRIEVHAQEPDGSPVTGQATVYRWFRDENIDAGDYVAVKSATVATVTLDATGHGAVEVPIGPSWFDRKDKGYPYRRHTLLGLTAEVGGTSTARGWSSRVSKIGQLEMPAAMTIADRIHRLLLQTWKLKMGDPTYDASTIYWAQRLATGTSRTTMARAIVDGPTWRGARVMLAYDDWITRSPDHHGVTYWSAYLQSHTTTQFDITFGSSSRARDAVGTTNELRGAHLSIVLDTNRTYSYVSQLNHGTTWPNLVRAAYLSDVGVDARALKLKYLYLQAHVIPGVSDARIRAELVRRGDERDALILIATTLR
jgi:hypothetical protein